MTLKKIIYIIAFVWSSLSYAQTDNLVVYNLNDCIDIAIANNLDLKSSKLNAERSKVLYKNSKNELLPNLNMDYNLGVNDGRNIDPYTNGYIDEQLTFSNLGVNLNLTLFNGLRIKNRIKQDKFELQASEMEIEEAKQDLILEVTLRYLQVLNGKDMLELAKARLETTKGQLDRLESHYNQGLGNPADYTDMLGQFSADEISVINARNTMEEAKLALIRLMSIDVQDDVVFASTEGLIATDKYQLTAAEVYAESLENLATFKAKRLRINAAESGVKSAKSNYFPELSAFGQLNTNYSSLANSLTQIGSTISNTGDFVEVNNQTYLVKTDEILYQENSIDYLDQFKNNYNTVVGLSLRVPIFNGFRAKNEVALEKIQLEESSVDLENTKLRFKQSIDEAYLRMESAYNRYFILEKQLASYEKSFRINEIRFNNGVSNIVEYFTSKNNLDTSKLNLSNAKYEYLLRVRVLDYYRGL